ncbi:DNA cytosine methyltransferase [Embleya sp. NPDC005575]|uniref:DNA cytosine methyltransferase n=1 Tax=Embleya sp. NPDC005575 TaxID=3156892 RepID=UPI0033B549B7
MTTPPTGPRIGSLCTGSGALDTAVTDLIGGHLAWCADNDPHVQTLLAYRHPDTPNLGDITLTDWSEVPPVDAIVGGFPCQDISNAGPREGLDGARSRLWWTVHAAVRNLRPRIVYLENVSALRGRGLDIVIGSLAAIGYDAAWTCVRASDAGATHRRDRWFCVAVPADDPVPFARRDTGTPPRVHDSRGLKLLPTPTSADGTGGPGVSAKRAGGMNLRTAVLTLPDPADCPMFPTPKASDGPNGGPNQRDGAGRYYLPGHVVNVLPDPEGVPQPLAGGFSPEAWWHAVDGTDYTPTIRRWETITGHTAPPPTLPSPRGGRRLSPWFVEWMMGALPGLICAVPGIPRAQQLKIGGNGAVTLQAYMAYAALMDELATADLEAA